MTIHRTSNYIRVEGCVLGLDIGEDFELFKIDPSFNKEIETEQEEQSAPDDEFCIYDYGFEIYEESEKAEE